MTTRYCGSGGSDSNDGLSWANRKLTLNGLEDSPVAANDNCYIGPGVYRELLTVDVSGSSGQPITYIGDVTGANTDGVGGIVRITGSDDDQTATRANCISATSKDYRSFSGFVMDVTTSRAISVATSGTGWTITNCFIGPPTTAASAVYFEGAGTANTVEHCTIIPNSQSTGITFFHSGTVSNAGHVIQNCVFWSGNGAIRSDRVGGITVRNCTFMPRAVICVQVATALAGGQTVTVNNCILYAPSTGFSATVTGEISEDYNCIYAATTPRTNTATGASSNTYPPLLNPPVLFNGVRYPWNPFELSEWSQVKGMGAPGLPTDDFFGTFRPTSGSKGSWGAIQYVGQEREITTTHSSSAASIKIPDWGGHQIWVPTTNTSTTISVYVYREADYSGTLPRMVIKQPSQSDRTTTDTGSAATWNQLTDTFTPSANTDYVVVELQSLNTATAGNYDVFFDDLTVS